MCIRTRQRFPSNTWAIATSGILESGRVDDDRTPFIPSLCCRIDEPETRRETLVSNSALLPYLNKEPIMNTTPDPLEPLTPSLGGLYESPEKENSSLRVQLGEHLDANTRDDLTRDELIRERLDRTIDDSLQSLERSAHSVIEYVKKNPLSVIAAVGGIAAIVAAMSRRRRWY
jgi:hypothetical protein